jgi:hypothetical protein
VTGVRVLLRLAGAALLAAVAVVHGRLWVDGYRSIDVIGPLFALDALLAGLGAVALLLAPRRHLPAVALAGAALTAGTAGGLLLSTRVALFGFRESLAAASSTRDSTASCAATVVLLLLALAAPARDRDAGRRDARPRATSR